MGDTVNFFILQIKFAKKKEAFFKKYIIFWAAYTNVCACVHRVKRDGRKKKGN
jgi:hypothetical protein